MDPVSNALKRLGHPFQPLLREARLWPGQEVANTVTNEDGRMQACQVSQ